MDDNKKSPDFYRGAFLLVSNLKPLAIRH